MVTDIPAASACGLLPALRCCFVHETYKRVQWPLQISDVKSADLLGKRMRLQGADNPDFTIDKAALPPVQSCMQGDSCFQVFTGKPAALCCILEGA